jgi:hypothetical protein
MLDELAAASENRGEFEVASRLDAISMLVVTASQDIPAEVSTLADDLKRHFPKMDTEHALHIANSLYAEHDVADEDEQEEGEEKESEIRFPSSALPNKERRQGPRPEDVPVGTVEWWDTTPG